MLLPHWSGDTEVVNGKCLQAQQSFNVHKPDSAPLTEGANLSINSSKNHHSNSFMFEPMASKLVASFCEFLYVAFGEQKLWFPEKPLRHLTSWPHCWLELGSSKCEGNIFNWFDSRMPWHFIHSIHLKSPIEHQKIKVIKFSLSIKKYIRFISSDINSDSIS